ncbi:MAG TPA: glycoside hydrolase family 27 protein [Chitinophagaceae bacterium]|jgi:alpha-galactosidase|nr:glycoside hydrolase family 27 protein [Chitinophagaceae bacterium]HRG91306.1 glycoside hydrolase family 27 protein [Chitinophagaceae bacterium]
MKKYPVFLFLFFCTRFALSQNSGPASVPPMGWMSWNSLAERVNEKDLREIAEVMVSTGMVEAGYNYIFIDDGWQGGRDNRNNIIPDPVKFPSGIRSLSDYLHNRGIRLGIYSDAAQLTCAGYTGSFGFEEQDARTFASWQIDYLKYDYCNAPSDMATAKLRYKAMADALQKTGRPILFAVCEWGERQPWLWAAAAGGHLWRTTHDIRDKWKMLPSEKWGLGILDILDVNSGLSKYAGPGRWNDADMLVTGLYGKKGPSGDGGGNGCTDTEYQSQFSLWAIMSAPLYASNDLRQMNSQTLSILLNREVIAVQQDPLGKPGKRIIADSVWNVFLKPMQNGDYSIAILNRSDRPAHFVFDFNKCGLPGFYRIRDLWLHETSAGTKQWTGEVKGHETKLLRLSSSH